MWGGEGGPVGEKQIIVKSRKAAVMSLKKENEAKQDRVKASGMRLANGVEEARSYQARQAPYPGLFSLTKKELGNIVISFLCVIAEELLSLV